MTKIVFYIKYEKGKHIILLSLKELFKKSYEQTHLPRNIEKYEDKFVTHGICVPWKIKFVNQKRKGESTYFYRGFLNGDLNVHVLYSLMEFKFSKMVYLQPVKGSLLLVRVPNALERMISVQQPCDVLSRLSRSLRENYYIINTSKIPGNYRRSSSLFFGHLGIEIIGIIRCFFSHSLAFITFSLRPGWICYGRFFRLERCLANEVRKIEWESERYHFLDKFV